MLLALYSVIASIIVNTFVTCSSLYSFKFKKLFRRLNRDYFKKKQTKQFFSDGFNGFTMFKKRKSTMIDYIKSSDADIIISSRDIFDEWLGYYGSKDKECTCTPQMISKYMGKLSGPLLDRIDLIIEVPRLTTDELIKIFLGMANKAGFIVNDDAISYLKEIIDDNRNMKNFGNARFVRNIYEKTVIRHASNVKDKKQKKILKTITKDDINTENLILDN